MGFLQWLGIRDRTAPPERVARASFSLGSALPPGVPESMYPAVEGTSQIANVARVTREEALQVPAVLRGRNLIAGQLSTLPLRCVDTDNRVTRLSLLEQIDPNVANVVTLAETFEDLLFEGVSWWQVLAYGWDGYPVSARHVHVHEVSTQPPAGFPIHQLPSGVHPEGVIWVGGKPVAKRTMIRFDSPNPPLLVHGARSIRRALKLERTADMYADDPRAQTYFTPTEGADPVEDDEVQGILDDWAEARRQRATGYIPAALKLNSAEQLSPADLQLADLILKATLGIANALGIDPEDLGVSTTSRTYQNAVDRRQDRTNETYAVYLAAVSERLSMGDVTPRGRRTVWKLDDWLKAAPKERWETYEIARRLNAVTVEEIRAEEDLPHMPEQPQEPLPAPRRLTAVPTGQEEPMSAHRTVQAAFTAAAGERLAFEADAGATFAVDAERRIMSGVAVPYGPRAIARYGGRRWRFERGSIRWPKEVQRVKHLRDHDRTQAVGRAASIDDTDAGLMIRLKVARGPEGDRLLHLAEDGVQDGLSVGVDIEDAVPDPLNPGVMLVRRAVLHEVSSTAMPAFDDSRVTDVAATREEPTMPCATCGQVHAPGTPCAQAPAPTPSSASFTLDQLRTALATPPAPARATAGFTAEQLDQLRTALAAPAPATVDPTARPVPVAATLTVNEPLPYRFDGRRHEHDFSSDVIALSKGSGEAGERIARFMSAVFEDPEPATIATGDVNELNPNRQRPDLYVDQLDYSTPIWDAINKGSLPDSTPFTLPKFNTSADLVDDHTEGQEPDYGSFTTTGQTITPSAVSGKVQVTRETWDQGGNPQFSTVLWRQITRAYFEGLEIAAAEFLDSLTPTGISLTGTDEALDADISAKLAALQFIRGGFRMRDLIVAEDLYTAVTGARASDGRALFPIIGASNVQGTTSQFFANVNVAGLIGRPAWALDEGDGSSYLFSREDVHGWATPPQRLQFEYRVAFIDVGVWGYKAIANTRLAGVREITWTSGDGVD